MSEPTALEPELAPGSGGRGRLVAVLVALFFTLVWYQFFGDVHFNAAEEGYLWYGTWRTTLGEVPLRDFQAYDPGRYWWAAAGSRVFGDGLTGLRRSGALFQGFGLFLGLLAARRATRASWMLGPLGLWLGLWMFPRHKVYESALCLAAVWVGVNLLERPTRRWHLGAGVFVGLAAVFGRNLGLYAALGTAVLIALSALKRRDARWLAKSISWGAGIVLGYLPILGSFVLVPGFWASFLRSLALLLRLGTNIEQPWPWPWSIDFTVLTPYWVVDVLCLQVVYALPPIVLVLGWWSAISARAENLPRRALFIAGAVLGTFTIHHAAVRSDPSHLAQAIQPTFLALFGGLALLGRLPGWLRRGLWSVFFGAAGFAALNHHPSLVHLGRASLVKTELGGSPVRLLPVHADYYARLVRTIESHVGPDEKLFIAPSRPGLYPIFHRRSPSWWIYFFVPEADRAEQEALVAELQDVPWILIVDKGIADREELRFRNSYDRVWTYITQSYQRVPTPELEPYHLLFRKRE